MEAKESLFRHPLWSSVFASVLVAAGASVLGYIFDWWPSIREGGGAVLVWFGKQTEVANWLLCLISIPVAAFLFFVGGVTWFKINPGSPVQGGPRWTDYTEDRIFGMLWRWRYQGGQIEQLLVFCPRCDFQVYPKHSGGFSGIDSFKYQCEACETHLHSINERVSYFENRVERTIQQRLRNGDWKAAVGGRQASLARPSSVIGANK